MLAPIPGKSAVGIEVPDTNREMSSSPTCTNQFTRHNHHPLVIGLGKDIEGEMISANLGKMPHLLVAGSTGSASPASSTRCWCRSSRGPPDDPVVLINTKMVELTPYEGICAPHHPDRLTQPKSRAPRWWLTVEEMEQRYQDMQANRVRTSTCSTRRCAHRGDQRTARQRTGLQALPLHPAARRPPS